MNKRLLMLLAILLILSTLVSYRFYTSAKKEVKEEFRHYLVLEKKMQKIELLRKKYKKRVPATKLQNCALQKKRNLLISCKNVDKNRFASLERILFRSGYRIGSF